MRPGERSRAGSVLANTYRLDSIIGTGSVGTVYRGWHLVLGKEIALKLIHPDLASDRTATKRFEREARAASHLSHPNCLEILDFGTAEDGTMYMVMEYVNGVDLATMLNSSFPISQLRIVRIFRQVVHALDRAHQEGVIHRDLKPENVMVTQAHRVHPDLVKVLDFGIAKILDSSTVTKDSFNTLTGMVPGTPHYMSPEQAQGQELDGRSDLYAIGIMLYELATGRVPFDAKNPMKVIAMHLQYEPKPPSKYLSAIHPDLEELILNLLKKDRDHRPNTSSDVMRSLERIEKDLLEKPHLDEKEHAVHPDIKLRPTLQNAYVEGTPKNPWSKALIIACFIGLIVAVIAVAW